MTRYHVSDGIYFERDDFGGIRVLRVAGADPFDKQAPCDVLLDVTPQVWASIVASMSFAGESGESWRAALAMHTGMEPAP